MVVKVGKKVLQNRISIMTLDFQSPTLYSFAYMQVMRTARVRPQNGAEAIKLWSKFFDLKASCRSTSTERILRSSESHAHKVATAMLQQRKCNVLLLPRDVPVHDWVVDLCGLLGDDERWARWQKQAWSAVPTGLHEVARRVKGEKLAACTYYPVVNNTYAITQAWLNKVLPTEPLPLWVSRNEYMANRPES